MRITNVPIDVKALLKGAMLVAINPAFEYKDGLKTDNIVGYKYSVMLPALNYDKCNVKIAGNKMLEVGDEAYPIIFDGVVAKIYNIDGRYDVSLSATSVKPATNVGPAKHTA